MKNISSITAAALLIPAMFITSANAADTTVINIKANIVATSCLVTTTVLNIDLGNIQGGIIQNAGSSTPWSGENVIDLTGCPLGTTSVDAKFTGKTAPNDTNGYKNTGGDDAVSVQLGDGASTPKYFSNNTIINQPIANNGAQIKLHARLYTSGVAKPGAVNSTVNVEFSYK